MPKAMQMMAEFPAAMPSMPSLRLAPLLTAVMTKMVTRTKRIQPACVLYFPQNDMISV